MKKVIPLILITLITIQLASSLGVVPSSQDVNYEPGTTSNHQLKIVNNEKAAKTIALYTQGDLSHLITLEQQTITFKEGESEKTTTFKINHPETSNIQGPVNGQIHVRETTSSKGQISAMLQIASKITLNIPYQGVYATTKLYVGDFSKGKGNFVIEVQNQGTDDIANAKTLLTITKTSGESVDAVVSQEERIPSKETHHFTIPWEANIPPGTYLATATTTYDGESKQDQKIFVIGAPEILVSHVDVQDFTLGGIAKFSLYLQNKWSEEIKDVYAVIKVKKGTQTYASSTTQTISIPSRGTNEVNAYWDTKNVVAGNYDLVITAFYGEETKETTIPISVTQDSIKAKITGQATTNTADTSMSNNPTTVLLGLLSLIVLATNIALFRKLLKKK